MIFLSNIEPSTVSYEPHPQICATNLDLSSASVCLFSDSSHISFDFDHTAFDFKDEIDHLELYCEILRAIKFLTYLIFVIDSFVSVEDQEYPSFIF